MIKKKLREYKFLFRSKETIRLCSEEDLIDIYLKGNPNHDFHYKNNYGEILIDRSQLDAIVVM